MPEEALATGQVGQPVSPEPQGGTATNNSATVQPGTPSAPEVEQPLSLTQSQLNQMIKDAMNAEKQNWLNEAYQNTQSMNDKFEARVNATIAQFEKAGIKNVDKVTAAKYLREQDRQAAADAQRQPQIDQAYQQFLNRFGARNPSDPRLQGAYSLEKEFGINLLKEDPEFTEFFGDPNKSWEGPYQFVRDYERALTKKKERSAQQNPQAQGNVAGLPSMSGVGKKSSAIPNTMKSTDIYDQWVAEMRNQR